MKFGKVEHPETVNFELPADHPDTARILNQYGKSEWRDIAVGCAKWNRKDLKSFYPRGTKDELTYYATQFKSIELNASFYRMFPKDQFEKWASKVGPDFAFFPKVPRYISHLKRLNDCQEFVTDFTANLTGLGDKLGMVFLQMPGNFKPKFIGRLAEFLEQWPNEIPLAVELRHPDWYKDDVARELQDVLVKNEVSNIITDSAGRRDMLHMRLSTDTAFIRFNGANHASDFTRLDDWLDRLEIWHAQGLKNLYFFVHQNLEKASPLLSAHFIKGFNERFKTDLAIPKTAQ